MDQSLLDSESLSNQYKDRVDTMDVDEDLADAAGFNDQSDSVSLGSDSTDEDRQVPYLQINSHTDSTPQCTTLAAKCRRRQNNLGSLI